MDELGKAVSQFYPSEGMFSSGGSSMPPSGPSDPTSWVLTSADQGEGPSSVQNPGGNGAGDGAGPSNQPAFVRNLSLESSIRNRVACLERDHSPFLFEEQRGKYWNLFVSNTGEASSQEEYNVILATENTYLEICERRHECYTIFEELLAAHPSLAEKACYSPQETFIDFFTEKRDELEGVVGLSLNQRDRLEFAFLGHVKEDLQERGANSIYIKLLLGSE
ncbi:uncharacterized protein LOC116190064 [Punica granatum]|nr:uncharacterized protein LOC116190029 [Punica granatum]XP_031375572.1 uncharacterized protein LOC116190033 [Punica granatum]XP_031375596.1 uncharacterized protein LOC116190064 [Punica granatum]PKH70597.1 hypothetical protein CRG98_050066 [Punica granatum]